MELQAILKNLVRVGMVSSVDVDRSLVRVEFTDKQDVDGKPLISAPLKVLQNQPFITIEKWFEEMGEDVKWDYKTEYTSPNRKVGLGESYVKMSYFELKDVIKNEKITPYEKLRQTVTVYPWLPYIGQLVVCLYLPNSDSDGFVIGGI